MDRIDTELKSVVLQLFDIGALKFGNFKMKVGINSPVYFDLRLVVSYPQLMDKLAELIWSFIQLHKIDSKSLCGVPYTALPIATLVAVKSNLPMLIRRKEPKAYGTMKLIEGIFNPGENCLIIEDVVTSGSSILETARDLKNDGLLVENAIIMLDREQGGCANLEEQGIKVHSLLTLSKVLKVLQENGKLDATKVEEVRAYISSNQISFKKDPSRQNRLKMKFDDRAAFAKNPLAARLFRLMADKRTNLCVALDVSTWAEVIRLVKEVGKYVAVVKLHYDAIADWTPSSGEELKQLADKYNFVIIEDRKYGDIGNTVKSQCETIFQWADGATMHSICGAGSLDGVKMAVEEAGNDKAHGVFLVAELSCQGHLITPAYVKKTSELATQYNQFVIGLVAQNPLMEEEAGFIQLTPGVSTKSGGDNLGQTYTTPQDAVLVKGGDLIVVGRAITKSSDPQGVAQEISDALWKAYTERISNP